MISQDVDRGRSRATDPRTEGRGKREAARFRVALVIVLVALIAPFASAAPAWESDWNHAFLRATLERKLVFVDFRASWCPPCRAMEAETFPNAEVVERLDRFVLLKIDVDKERSLPRKHRVDALPAYLILDPQERERFRFIGFHSAEELSNKLDLVIRSSDLMIRAGEMLEREESAESWMMVGHAYLHAWDTKDARAAYGKAKTLAHKAKNAEIGQMADVQLAYALGLEKKSKAIRALRAIASNPVTPACRVASLLALGRVHQMSGDRAEAEKAFTEAIENCPEDVPMKREAEMALASLR